MSHPQVPAPDAGLLCRSADRVRQAGTASTCHSDRGKAGGLSLASFDAAKLVDNAAVAEKMIRKLRLGMMPPPGARRPEPAALAAFAESLETRLDRAAALNPNPGRRPFQRMNRAEYARAINSLLDLDIDVAPFLPPDTISHGFDNVADVQTLSPTLMEGYLRAASQISRLAVGDRNASATSTTYKIGRTMSQMRHIEGTPIGTRGGTAVTHVFPADGDYVFKVAMHYEPLGGLYGRSTMTTFGITEQVEVSIDGERVAVLDLNTRMSESDPKNNLEPRTPPIHVVGRTAQGGRCVHREDQRARHPRRFVDPGREHAGRRQHRPGHHRAPAHARLHRDRAATRSPASPTRRAAAASSPAGRRHLREEAPCAEQIVKRLGTQAFRGAADRRRTQGLMAFYEQGRKRGDFENGVRLALQAILASPRFVFRFEEATRGARTARAYRVNDVDLASRLAFFLWASVPDAELLKVASAGHAADSDRPGKAGAADASRPEGRSAGDAIWQSVAASAGSRASSFPTICSIQTTTTRSRTRSSAKPSSSSRTSCARIGRSSSCSRPTTRSSTSASRVTTASPTWPGRTSGASRCPRSRRGMLGQGSILALTSNSDRTSPVQRGKWVMEVLLGSPPPAPPPNVPSLDETKPTGDGKFLSVRERMEEHRKNPSCNSCHRVIDPLGLALENFDVTGAWRIKDNEVADRLCRRAL